MTDPEPMPIDYRTPRVVAPLILYQWAMVCGLVPAVVGICMLMGYAATDNQAFAGLGFLVLVSGGVMVLAGLILATIYLSLAAKATDDRDESLKRGRKARMILLLNIPLAIVCSCGGISLVFSPKVKFELTNTGTSAIESGSIDVGGETHTFGRIAVGETIKKTCRIGGAGKMTLTVMRNGKPMTDELASYVDSDSFGGGWVWSFQINDDNVVRK